MSNKFTFNASAIGLGGVITENGCTTVIPSLASVALAPTGGEGSSRVENYCVNGISFSRAETRVIGYETSNDVFTTTTDILITNLNIRDRLKVALMQATITSTRRMESDDSEFNLHALYRGIELDGDEVEPILDVDLCSGPCGKASTYDDFLKKFGGQISRNAIDSGVENEDLQKALTSNVVPMPGTLVTSTQMRRHGKVVAYPGNRVGVEGLGSAFLGELLVKRGRRRVNLLRFDFGSPSSDSAVAAGVAPVMTALASTDTTGSLTVGSGDGNGEPVWPHH
jgi:hypothetical protein